MRIVQYFLLIILLATCKTGTVEKPFDWQGHRGARGEAPENTIPAMMRALQEGVLTLELDVVISADSQVVVSHEPFFNPQICIGPDGASLRDSPLVNLFKLSYQEIQAYDCGSKTNPKFPSQANERIAKPLLIDLLSACEETALMMGREMPNYNIEIKSKPEWDGVYSPDYKSYADLVLEVLDKADLKQRLVLQSFDPRVLQYLHDKRPELKLSFLIDNGKEDLKDHLNRLGFIPDVISPHYQLVNQGFLQNLKALKVQVVPWTVNEIEEAQRLKEMGVDGIITDYPARMISALGRY